jgi:preprotein translocase subunit SecG
MVILITVIHVIVCLILVVVVLLQSGKAADLAGAFGGMGSQTVFGPRGSATVLSKATTISAILFMLTSLTLSILATRSGSATPDLFKKAVPPAAGKAPAPGQVPISVQGGAPGAPQGAPQQIPIQVTPTPVAPAPAAPSQQK